MSFDAIRREKIIRDHRAAVDRLGYCNYCDEEYTNAGVLIIDGEPSCPKCRESDSRTYYFCEYGHLNPCQDHA